MLAICVRTVVQLRLKCAGFCVNLIARCALTGWMYKERLGYVRNPRSLMEGTETLCRDDIGDLPGSPEHL